MPELSYEEAVNNINSITSEFVGMTLVSIVWHEPDIFSFMFAKPGERNSGHFIEFQMSTKKKITSGEWKYDVPV